jgi:hypothetical protein
MGCLSEIVEVGIVLAVSATELVNPYSNQRVTGEMDRKANNMRNRIKLVLAAVAVVGLTGIASATTVTLDSLLAPGASIQVGDKLFSNFGWNSATIPSAGVNVQAIDQSNPLFVGNYGIDIQGSFTQFGPGTIDADLTYKVSVIGSQRISDVHQVVNGGGIGDFVASVSEVLLSAPNGVTLGSLFNGASSTGNFQVGSADIVPPVSQLWVNKDINLLVGPNGVTASISDIQQTFSQTGTPDGGMTLALLGIALLGVEGLRRKIS